MKSQTEVIKHYDSIAVEYDDTYSSDEYVKENKVLGKLLSAVVKYYNPTSIYDIGCGTGLLLDLVNVGEARYNGIDPSAKMLAVAAKKHPGYYFRQGFLMDYSTSPYSSLYFALYGVGDYLSKEELQSLTNRRSFVMCSAPGYSQKTTGDPIDQKQLDLVCQLFDQQVVFNGKYLIATSNLNITQWLSTNSTWKKLP